MREVSVSEARRWNFAVLTIIKLPDETVAEQTSRVMLYAWKIQFGDVWSASVSILTRIHSMVV